MPAPKTAPTILLTGFEPFEDDPVNPAWEIARALDGEVIAGATVHGVELPCVFGDSITALDAAIEHLKPVLVVALGFAGNRCEITPERVAINLDDARIADNAGRQPVDTQVVEGGPSAYFTTLPIKAMTQAMLDEGVAASVSNTAGTFVCNHIFYAVMHSLAQHSAAPGARGGFIHIPPLPEMKTRGAQQTRNGMDLATQVRGIRAALHAAMTVTQDLRVTAGQIS
ncbi:pyroglutamyl-peptidase I [Diaphorobacter aerolatus]|uniref:Pyrrolidone-carboxylate peptidase n=1 Tax=Diaphorobacter aerolatus TaxID=1288495 RepID=A0A7H0GP20_9BURK|nr:pyroglutamyl-peptidase I [Diaphorobacter aerolatus]QNP50036.1 pyroglutamyl-peptidase I [Diaphorobacter aerolatus]